MIFLVKEFGRQLASKMPKAKAIKTNQLVRWCFENTLKTQHCSANACKTQPCTCLIEDQSCSLENLSLDCHLSDFSSFQFVDVFWMNNPTQLMISSGSSNAALLACKRCLMLLVISWNVSELQGMKSRRVSPAKHIIIPQVVATNKTTKKTTLRFMIFQDVIQEKTFWFLLCGP